MTAVLATGKIAEPLSLRQLRESISSLEGLEGKRVLSDEHGHWMHDNFDAPAPARRMPAVDNLSSRALPRFASPEPRLSPSASLAKTQPTPSFATDTASALERAKIQLSATQHEREELQQRTLRQVEVLQRERDDALRRNQELLSDLREQGRLADERIENLTRERDTVMRHSNEKEAAVIRLQCAVDSSNAKERQLREECDNCQAELKQARAELEQFREEKLQALERQKLFEQEADSARKEMEDRHERTVVEHWQRIRDLEATTDRATRDLSARADESSELAVLVFQGVRERALLLRFLLDLLCALQALLFAPALAKSASRPARSKSPGRHRSPGRPSSRSCMVELGHKHKGCVACRGQSKSPVRASHSPGRRGKRPPVIDTAVVYETCQVIAALELELAGASQEFSRLLERVRLECESCARLVGLAPSVGATDFVLDSSALLVVDAWAKEERRRLHCPVLTFEEFVPRMNWARESQLYHAVAHATESIGARLANLRKTLRVGKVGGDGVTTVVLDPRGARE